MWGEGAGDDQGARLSSDSGHAASALPASASPSFELLLSAGRSALLPRGRGEKALTLRVTDLYGTKVCVFYRTRDRASSQGRRLAAVLGQQLVGSAVSLQGVLGVEVLRQLGLAAHQGPVLLQVLLCLGVCFG